MTSARSAARRIEDVVSSWPGIRVMPGHRGELAFKLGRREIGHLHGDRAAHFTFPKPLFRELLAEGRIVPHPIFPDSPGYGARRIETDGDVADVIALLRLNYDRAVERRGRFGAEEGAWG